MIWFVLFLACVPAANWLVAHVDPIPVGFGFIAPAGVLVAGAAFVLRDLLHRNMGAPVVYAAIGLGGLVSALIAPPALALASIAAFLSSEGADMAVYTGLARRRFLRAVAASSLVGLTVDSVVFLAIAFGDLSFLWGQILGKSWMLALGMIVLAVVRPKECAR